MSGGISARIFTDGASRGNPGPAGAGAIIESGDGAVEDEISEYIGERTNNAAEYIALILALQRAYDLGKREIELYLDSQLVVEQLLGKYKVKSSALKPLYEKATELISRFDSASVSHVHRAENAKADELANDAIDRHLRGEVRLPNTTDTPEQRGLF